MRKSPLLPLLLLAVLAFSLLAGVHPCGSLHAAAESKPAAKASCHDTGGKPPEPRKSSDDSNCCDTFCRHACHIAAIAVTKPSAFTMEPIAQTVAEASGSAVLLFAQPIDHVPLA